jgi:predicted RNA-binding Zn-ribbon protein involved in translation (DUF1610 family)
MTYIRCPQCGQRALSVATVCPKCGFVLAQNPMQLGRESGLVACHSCGKMMDRDATECPYCGHRPGWWTGTRVGIATAIAVVLVAAGIMAVRALVPHGEARPPSEVISAPQPLPTVEDSTRIAASHPDTVAATVATAAVVPTGRPIVAAPPPAEAATPRPAPAGLVARWTVTWVNLREGRDTVSAVVRIYQPDTRIEVADPRGGWWTVYENGVVVGYIAGSELREEPGVGRHDSGG